MSPDYSYAHGRIAESLAFISEELKEFDEDYADKERLDYESDRKLQKLIDRTAENILTALIEVCGSVLTQESVVIDSYAEALGKCAALLGFSDEEQQSLAKLAAQRNRLAHRYLDFRWLAIQSLKANRGLIIELATRILAREET